MAAVARQRWAQPCFFRKLLMLLVILITSKRLLTRRSQDLVTSSRFNLGKYIMMPSILENRPDRQTTARTIPCVKVKKKKATKKTRFKRMVPGLSNLPTKHYQVGPSFLFCFVLFF